MNREAIGKVCEAPFVTAQGFIATLVPGNGANFPIDYDEKAYNIALTNNELDRLFETGLARELGRLSCFDRAFNIKLPNPELPLLAMVISLETDDPDAGWDVLMETIIVTMSSVHECRGILTTVGVGDEEKKWTAVCYEELPPLEEPQPGDPFYLHPALQGV